jgi:hypothetical protein
MGIFQNGNKNKLHQHFLMKTDLHILHIVIEMTRILTIHVIPTNDSDSDDDDVITFSTHSRTPGLVTLTYVSKDIDENEVQSEAVLTREGVMSWTHNFLCSLMHDKEPYYQVQINSSIGPIVLYNITDLVDLDVFQTIELTVYNAVYASIRRV